MIVRHYFWYMLYKVVKALIGHRYYVSEYYDLDSMMRKDKQYCLGFSVIKIVKRPEQLNNKE